MRLCILDNDILEPEAAARWGSYGRMSEQLLRRNGFSGEVVCSLAREQRYPADLDRFDALLLTGSRADAFGDEPWVQTLREQVRQALARGQRLLGICFGHQLIAHVMGAPVGRAPQGWGRGCMDYEWLGAPDVAAEGRLDLLASHQDQVLALPPGAQLLARNAHCPVAAYQVGQQVLCVQAHPEFDPDYSAYLLGRRRAQMDEAVYTERLQSLKRGHDGDRVGRLMVQFLHA